MARHPPLPSEPPPALPKCALPCPPEPIPVLLSVAGVAALFDRSERTIRRWAACGHLLPVRIGGAAFFRAGDVAELISGRLRETVQRRMRGTEEAV